MPVWFEGRRLGFHPAALRHKTEEDIERALRANFRVDTEGAHGRQYIAAVASWDMRGLPTHKMDLRTTMPLLLQALVEHFAVECSYHDEMDLVAPDWSSHHFDAYASSCVASFVAAPARRLYLHPSLYYANSLTTHPRGLLGRVHIMWDAGWWR